MTLGERILAMLENGPATEKDIVSFTTFKGFLVKSTLKNLVTGGSVIQDGQLFKLNTKPATENPTPVLSSVERPEGGQKPRPGREPTAQILGTQSEPEPEPEPEPGMQWEVYEQCLWKNDKPPVGPLWRPFQSYGCVEPNPSRSGPRARTVVVWIKGVWQ